MVIEMLPALITAIRAAALANANDNAGAGALPATAASTASRPGSANAAETPEPPAGPPLVRALRRRPGARYATAGNVILPLAFAERMPGWRARAAPRP